jgi:hypothetical protein
MDEHTQPRHPLGAEIDDSPNPTTSAPADGDAERGDASAHHDHADESAGSSRQREMLRQVQEMIDSLAREAKPVMRELAAKSAELAAIAAERAGPLAARAAEKTQAYGERFAARSKDMAADLRRHEEPGTPGVAGEESPEGSESGEAQPGG